jgi:hypothetical protein
MKEGITLLLGKIYMIREGWNRENHEEQMHQEEFVQEINKSKIARRTRLSMKVLL